MRKKTSEISLAILLENLKKKKKHTLRVRFCCVSTRNNKKIKNKTTKK